MKTAFNLRLPEELCHKIENEARKNNLSINQYILFTLTKIIYFNEALETVNKKIERASKKSVREILHTIPARTPLPGDEL